MWYLDSNSDQKVIYVVSQNREVTIGRTAENDANYFVIPDDPSISRKHAILSVVNNELFVKDLGSRYGTFLNSNESKIESNAMVKLDDQDVIKFGKMGSVWKVHNKHLITCTSTLKGENILNLKQCLTNLSGILKNEWDEDCCFLTMPAITLTMKVVLALVRGAHIVTVDYWNECLKAVIKNNTLPDPKLFTPQIIESTLNKESVSFLPDNKRQSLFNGKKVVFFSKRQFEMYKSVLSKASANPLLLSDSKMTKTSLCEQDVIVIQYNMNTASQETQAQRNMIQDIINYLKSKGKRVVTDVEIGLAVLYCSTEKYCNPEFSFPSEVIKQAETNTKPSNVLAQESQEPSNENKKENVVINESITSDSRSKRKTLDDDDIQENPNKKVATDNILSNNGCNKRRLSEENDNGLTSKKLATEESNDSQEGFNFINNTSSNNSEEQNNSGKRLNLVKPQKRKLNIDDNEDDLFQFVQDRSKIPCHSSKSNIFDTNKVERSNTDLGSTVTNIKSELCTDVDISSLRGSKLEELMKSNEKLLSSDYVTNNVIKKELVEKLNDLELGTTIVTIKKELIVKKEPIEVEELSSQVKNFKKFKKVWPVKMQVTVIPRSSMISHNQINSNNILESV